MSWKSSRFSESRAEGVHPRKFYIESLGCAKNQVDSELMIAELEAAGWRYAEAPEEAEAIIVNTCGFISDAKKESIETALSFKARHPGKKVYMVGCLAERYAEKLAADMPEIDGFMGNRDSSGISALLEGRGRKLSRAASEAAPGAGARKDAQAPAQGHGRPQAGARKDAQAPVPERKRLLSFPGSAYVKIAEGCGNRCTYCAIPLIRGDLRSRRRGQVVEEVRDLLGRGIRELVLIAQDLGSFGTDRGVRELPALLQDLSELKGDFWVRLLYIHPDHFPMEILPVMSRDARLLPYFDIPFQHASPEILEAMGRRGDPEKNLELVRRIRGVLPLAVVRSTFLVGFPGETDQDFNRLLDFQADVALDWMGVFTYSREEDTAAFRVRPPVPRKTAGERKRLLEQRQTVITERALDRHLGRELSVLIEEPVAGEEMSIGRTYLQAPEVDGLTVIGGSYEAGEMVRARIFRRNGLDLEGESLDG